MGKGIGINVVVALVVALTGVLLFIGLITGTLQESLTMLYCGSYIRIAGLMPSSENPSIPDVCVHGKPLETFKIDESDNKKVSRILLSYIISCWNKVENLRLDKDYACYELVLTETVDNVNEGNVSSILIKEDHCSSIENSDYGCGAKDQIVWSVAGGVINTQKVLLIYYDYTNDCIMVKG